MRKWLALFGKDFKLTRTVFFVGLLMNVLIFMVTLYLGRVADDSLLMFVPLAIGVAIHVIYVPILVFVSLKSEGNHLPVWLNNPQPAFKLLLSKLANGLMMIVISLALLYVLSGLLIVPKFSFIEPYWTDIESDTNLHRRVCVRLHDDRWIVHLSAWFVDNKVEV
ncbi:hypothetical protein [Tumebacillus flagellatus]|uniref:Uncharacterized protein n=1 Tax=Tumebacillus flagellatus TaxID=1157490 RepID=A0A074LXU8_9BACL|nr:hypothetical protein [Tumebacillus flagellatus]KEO84958.1 hypothetical protein EL26_02855 [Tumebacillus flagellatus]